MQKKKRILLKVGSNTLTKETDNISRGKIEDIAKANKTIFSYYFIALVVFALRTPWDKIF